MSVLEIEKLDERLSGDSLPCDVSIGIADGVILPCGQPAVARIRFSCECGNRKTGFCCAPHLELMDMMQCPVCGRSAAGNWRPS